MKKFRVFLFSVAIVAGVGSALAAKTINPCEYYPQYRYLNGVYTQVGEFGSQYVCWQIGGICTYYKTSYFSPYLPCRTGLFIPM